MAQYPTNVTGYDNPFDRPSWWARNRKWLALTTGISLAICCLLVLCAGLVAGSIGAVFSMIRQADVYQIALEQLRTNPQAKQALGEPIQPGWIISGSINIDEHGGSADFATAVSGPKASGMLYVVAEKPRPGATWQFDRLVLEVDGSGQSIDLLADQ